MSFEVWLQNKIDRLREEIATSAVFTEERPATREELLALKAKVTIMMFLEQELARRSRDEDIDDRRVA